MGRSNFTLDALSSHYIISHYSFLILTFFFNSDRQRWDGYNRREMQLVHSECTEFGERRAIGGDQEALRSKQSEFGGSNPNAIRRTATEAAVLQPGGELVQRTQTADQWSGEKHQTTSRVRIRFCLEQYLQES